jgi:hypothetical protein
MIDKTINKEFEKFKENNTGKYFNMDKSSPSCRAFSDATYRIFETDAIGKPIHMAAIINVEDLMDSYKIAIKYRMKYYPDFGVHAENIAKAFEGRYTVDIADMSNKKEEKKGE